VCKCFLGRVLRFSAWVLGKQRVSLALIAVVVGLIGMACQSRILPHDFSPLTTTTWDESPLAGGRMTSPPPRMDVPTPSPGYGVVTGRFVDGESLFAGGVTAVFLADVIEMDDGRYAAFLDRSKAPIEFLEPDSGWFAFSDVRPGLYALVLSDPEMGSRALMTPDGDVEVVEVVAGAVVDLGAISVGY